MSTPPHREKEASWMDSHNTCIERVVNLELENARLFGENSLLRLERDQLKLELARIYSLFSRHVAKTLSATLQEMRELIDRPTMVE